MFTKVASLIFFCCLSTTSGMSFAEQSSRSLGKAWSPDRFTYDRVKGTRGEWGFTARDFYGHYKTATEKLKKGEFESTELFLDRLKKADSIVTPFNSISEYVFTFRDTSYTYDPDNQAFLPKSPNFAGCGPSVDFDGWYSCEIGAISKNTVEKVGSNAFGVKREFYSTEGSDLILLVRGDSELFQSILKANTCFHCKMGWRYAGHALIVPLDRARKIGNRNIRVAITGRILEHGLHELAPHVFAATLNAPYSKNIRRYGVLFDPQRIVYYSSATGETLFDLPLSPRKKEEIPVGN